MNNQLAVVIVFLFQIVACAWTPVGAAGKVSININPGIRYQTITGWEAVTQAGEDECKGFDLYAEELFDLAVNDLGINRVRLEIKSGVENSTDYYSLFRQGKITRDEWKKHRYEIINDNNDPQLIDRAHFQFTELDSKIDRIIIPLKEVLAARGETLYVNVNYVDFGASDFEHKNNPQEYAEFVLATYQHIQGKYGWTPDAWEVVLEPENAKWSPPQIGNAIAMAASRLKENGYEAFFISPSTTDMGKAVTYFDKIIQIPGVQPYLKELSYHRYSGESEANLKAIGERAVKYGIDTAMLEHIGSDYRDLHQDLKVARNSAWQQYTLAYCGLDDNGGAYYHIGDRDPSNPVLSLGKRSKYLRQYFKYIRHGAVRIEASSDTEQFDPVSFINKDGSYVVVVKSTQGGSFSIQGLPAGRYGTYYTTAADYDVRLKDISLQIGQQMDTSIPAAGVITVFKYPVKEGGTVYLPIINQGDFRSYIKRGR